jgi:cathepsin D
LVLSNYQNVQFFGDVFIGSPPQRVTMVFDTGSGQFVVRSKGCTDCSEGEGNAGYSPKASSTSVTSTLTYRTTYLSGKSKGSMVHDRISVGGLEAPSVLIAVAEAETQALEHFQFDGAKSMLLHRIIRF